MAWYEFIVRHAPTQPFEAVAHEMVGKPPPVYRTTGKVEAWTRWGARRYLRRKFGGRLIEIVELRKAGAR